ncbi:MAG TPA: hypothetical protein PLC65_14255, partial [Bacteroidia bacterium]|nr:hypothetical protein [Bacteroidia bacterium]
GDEAFKAQNWSIAKESYTEASALKQDEQYPKYKLIAIEKAIVEDEEQKKEIAKMDELTKKYSDLLKLAEGLMAKKLWT